MHMQENEELKSMPDPNQVGAGAMEAETENQVDAKAPGQQAAENLPKGSALDPDMKVVKNYVRKTAEEQSKDEI